MEQGGGWSLREGSFTVNTRGRLDCAIFFLLPRGPRHERELQQSAAVTRWWRACGREGRDCGLTAATSARPGCAVRCRRELVRTRVSSPAWSLCCESCVQCGPTVYSATRRACGRCLHAAGSRLCADCSDSDFSSLPQRTAHTSRALVAAVRPQSRPSQPQALHHLVTAAALMARTTRSSKEEGRAIESAARVDGEAALSRRHPPPCSMQVQPIVTTRISTVVASQAELQQRSG
eukprot:scaffold12965_cov39-Phaeocystis_antarctica.AAC.1